MVHVGGNDILHRLLPRLLYLAADVGGFAARPASRVGSARGRERCAVLVRRVGAAATDAHLGAALDGVARADFRRVVVLSMPILAAPLPL